MITVVDNRHDGADGGETITRTHTHTHTHRRTDRRTERQVVGCNFSRDDF